MKALSWYRNNWYYVGGGIFVVLAIVMSLFGERYDRYPMNKNTSFVCNVCIMYPLYIAGIIFSNCYI